ncbi:hypothetical protein ACN47E_000104 [Coniothyrium glycines]
MAPPGVNAFYYYAFTAIDPLLSLSAVYMNLFAPEAFLDPAFARTSALGKLNASHAYLQHQSAGTYAMFIFLMIFMLPSTDDLKLWKKFQGGLLFTDVAALYAMWKAVEAQRGEWRIEGISNVVILLVIAVTRTCFVTGIGVGKSSAEKKST